MRVLLTGMTSAQCNPRAHTMTGNYSGYLSQALTDLGHTVEQRDPRIDEDLSGYGLVIVGVAPIASLGANRAYGALSIIGRLRDDPRLRLLVDAPDPERIEVSLNHMLADPAKLTKPFFSYRKEYELASTPQVRAELLHAIEYLSQDTWPLTISPSLPWTLWAAVEERLPLGARGRVRLLNVDPWVLDSCETLLERVERPDYWAYEPSGWDRWLGQRHVSWDVVKVPRSHRVPSDVAALQVMRDARGTLIAGTKRGLWWNTRFVQSLAQHTPVFTDWFESWNLSDSFAQLPANFEYEPDEDLVDQQRKDYLFSAVDKSMSLHRLNTILRRE